MWNDWLMNWNRNTFRAGILIWLVSLAAAFAGPGDDFKSANQYYDAGKFAEAAAIYERIEPKTAHVYYNLGNAHFREGKPGLAILDYERARRLAPRDPDILANLKFAEQRLGVDEANTPPRAWERFLRSVIESRTSTEWGVCELLALWLTVLALGYEVVGDRAAPAAIVVAVEAAARFAPMADSTTHFKLAEGTRVVIREDRGQWQFVERSDGQQGWVKSDTLERVAPQD